MTINTRSKSGSMPGLASRLAASNMLAMVVDDKASLETLTDTGKGYQPYLRLEARDQSLVRAILLTSLRNRNRILTALAKCWNRKPPQKARHLLFSLEIAAAQILFMDVPQSAAVNLAVSAVQKDRRTLRFAGFANAVLRSLVRQREVFTEAGDETPIFPPWMQKQLATDYGKAKAAAISAALYREPAIDLQFKAWPDPALSEFENLSLALPGNARRLSVSLPIDELPGFQEGNWWVQDIAAAQPVRLLGEVNGKRVADLCAAPGGKTMQLAALGAEVTAVDISSGRLKRLEENLARTGLTAHLVTAEIADWQPAEPFDAILLDVPCTATGTIRRHPDILWNTEPADMKILVALQNKLIARAAGFLKPGGVLVYANCSLFKAEGENLVASLNNDMLQPDPINPEELPGLEHTITGQHIYRALPHYRTGSQPEPSGMDGFFAARFRRTS